MGKRLRKISIWDKCAPSKLSYVQVIPLSLAQPKKQKLNKGGLHNIAVC